MSVERISIKSLPNPVSVLETRQAKIEVFRAKRLGNAYWDDQVLYELVLEARKSFMVYGNRPLLDKYDLKAAIYLARAICTSNAHEEPTEEWLSYRFVPYNGNLAGAGEFELFGKCRGLPISTCVKNKLFPDFKSFKECLKYLVASSRMCGIRPRGLQKNKYTAACFALINKHFWDSCKDDGISFHYITGIIVNEFVDSTLTINVGGKLFPVHFTPAYETLDVEERDIVLDRSAKNLYIYCFPSYFLNVYELIETLKGLIKTGVLTEETFREFQLPTPFGELETRTVLSTNQLHNLGELLTRKGRIKIAGSKISGSDLRKIIDEGVGDGPRLKITKVEDRIKSVEELLGAFCNL